MNNPTTTHWIEETWTERRRARYQGTAVTASLLAGNSEPNTTVELVDIDIIMGCTTSRLPSSLRRRRADARTPTNAGTQTTSFKDYAAVRTVGAYADSYVAHLGDGRVREASTQTGVEVTEARTTAYRRAVKLQALDIVERSNREGSKVEDSEDEYDKQGDITSWPRASNPHHGIVLSPLGSGPAHASIELTFTVRLAHPFETDYRDAEVRSVVYCLERNGIPVLHGRRLHDLRGDASELSSYMGQQRAKAQPFEAMPGVAMRDYFWVASEEHSVDEKWWEQDATFGDDGKEVVIPLGRGVKLRSPLLQGEGLQSIQTVCDLLQDQPGVKLFINSRSKLNIAMDRATFHSKGNIRLKQAVFTFWIVESFLVQLDDWSDIYEHERRMLCSVSSAAKNPRYKKGTMDGNVLHSLLQYVPRIWFQVPEMAPYKKLGTIWTAVSTKELARTIQNHYGIQGMLTAIEETPGLLDQELERGVCEYIWMRMFRGTLDGTRIVGLVELCVACLELARLPAKKFHPLFTEICLATSILDVIPKVGLGHKLEYWIEVTKQLAGHDGSEMDEPTVAGDAGAMELDPCLQGV